MTDGRLSETMFSSLDDTRYDGISPGAASGRSALSYSYDPEHAADHTRGIGSSRSVFKNGWETPIEALGLPDCY